MLSRRRLHKTPEKEASEKTAKVNLTCTLMSLNLRHTSPHSLPQPQAHPPILSITLNLTIMLIIKYQPKDSGSGGNNNNNNAHTDGRRLLGLALSYD